MQSLWKPSAALPASQCGSVNGGVTVVVVKHHSSERGTQAGSQLAPRRHRRSRRWWPIDRKCDEPKVFKPFSLLYLRKAFDPAVPKIFPKGHHLLKELPWQTLDKAGFVVIARRTVTVSNTGGERGELSIGLQRSRR